MKKLTLSGLIRKLYEAVIRFPFVIAAIAGLALLFYMDINDVDFKLKISYWIFFSLSIFLHLAVSLWFENIKNYWLKYSANIFAVLLLFLYVYLLPEKLLPYQEPQQFILGMLLLFSCFYIAFLKRNQDDAFWVFSKKSIIQGVTSYVFAGILMGGLSLAAFSLEQLFGVNISEKVYENLSVSCFIVFAPLYLLSNIPGKAEKYDTDFEFNKVLKILGLYILLPVLMLYTMILYVYLIKIILIWELPDGWVSTLVSVLALAGFLCLLIVYPLNKTEQNKVVSFLSRYFPLILMPLLILMTVGILRRLQDYGFTINRLYVLILNVWFYAISIYLFFTKSRHLKWIVISLVLTGLVFSVGPLSVYKINERMMSKELSKLLIDNGLMKNNELVVNTNVTNLTKEQKSRIYELVTYVRSNYSNAFFRKHYGENIQDSTISKLQQRFYNEDMVEKVSDNYNHYKALSDNDDLFPVDKYKYLLDIRGTKYEKSFKLNDENVEVTVNDDELIVIYGNKKEFISLQSEMKKFAALSNDIPYSLNDATVSKTGFTLIIKKINFNQKAKSGGKFDLTYFEAYLLFK
jgi:hypothetical protein